MHKDSFNIINLNHEYETHPSPYFQFSIKTGNQHLGITQNFMVNLISNLLF